jgi:phage head maturation protease
MGIGPFEFYTEGLIISAVRAGGGSGCDEDRDLLNDVNKFTLRPLERDEFAVFTMDLCNNQIDAHYSRFPVDELESINEMVPGRPFMERHDTKGTLPRGTFFRSRLHEEAEGEYVSVRPDVYILHTDENRDLIANIEGGVYRATSIGFSFMHPECSICHKDIRTCDHVPGRTYGDESCHYVMHEVVSVLEGSVVFSASQGTGFVAARDDASRPTASEALSAARAAYHRPIEIVGTVRQGIVEPPWPHFGEE